MRERQTARCDLYQNPYKTRCSGSISPDGEVSVCWRHLAAGRDEWMQMANELALKVAKRSDQHVRGLNAEEEDK